MQLEGWLQLGPSLHRAVDPGSLWWERQVTEAELSQDKNLLHQSLAAIEVNFAPKPDGSRNRTFSPTIYSRRKSLLQR